MSAVGDARKRRAEQGAPDPSDVKALGTFLAGLVDGEVDEVARAVLASDWLATHVRAKQAEALQSFADTRGVNVVDEDSAWWQGYRQAQRECLRDVTEYADRLEQDR